MAALQAALGASGGPPGGAPAGPDPLAALAGGGGGDPLAALAAGGGPGPGGGDGQLAALLGGAGPGGGEETGEPGGGAGDETGEPGGNVANWSSTDHIRAAIKHLMLAVTNTEDDQTGHGILKGMTALQGILGGKAKSDGAVTAAGGTPARG